MTLNTVLVQDQKPRRTKPARTAKAPMLLQARLLAFFKTSLVLANTLVPLLPRGLGPTATPGEGSKGGGRRGRKNDTTDDTAQRRRRRARGRRKARTKKTTTTTT